MTGFRPQFWPTVFAVPIVLLCLGLGAWQIQRLHWKEGLIAERAAAVAAPAIPVPQDDAVAPAMEFRRVTDNGVFLNDKEIFLGATSEGGVNGYHILTPLREADGRIVFVNRGFIPAELRDRAKRQASEPTGAVRIEGLLRLPPERPAELVSARQPPRSQLLVLGRSAGDGGRRQARSCRAVLHRCGCRP